MKRVVKKLCWISAGILLLCCGWLVSERISGIRHLNAYLKSLRAKGEKLDVSELEPGARPDPSNNVVVALLAMSNRFDSIRELSYHVPLSARMIAPGRAVAAQRLRRWFRDKNTTNTWEALEAELDQQRPVLDSLYTALEKSEFDLNVDYHGDFDQPRARALSITKTETLLLIVSALNETRRGNLAAAQPYLLAAIHLVSHQPNERLLISQLVRQALVSNNYNSVWAILSEPGWTDGQLAALQRAWTPIDLVADFQASLEVERDMQIEYFKRVENTPGKLSKELAQPDLLRPSNEASESEDTMLSKLRPLQCLAWRWVWKEQDLLLTLEGTQHLLERSKTARETGFFAIESRVRPSDDPGFPLADGASANVSPGLWNRFRFPISSHESAMNDLIIRKALCAQTKQQMMCAALACHRYRLATGVWPERLDQLVPKYLASVPSDPLGGGLLVYRRGGPSGFVLYSKGGNGVDDGGNPAVDDQHIISIMDYGKDMVWPVPATAEEADAALLKAQ